MGTICTAGPREGRLACHISVQWNISASHIHTETSNRGPDAPKPTLNDLLLYQIIFKPPQQVKSVAPQLILRKAFTWRSSVSFVRQQLYYHGSNTADDIKSNEAFQTLNHWNGSISLSDIIQNDFYVDITCVFWPFPSRTASLRAEQRSEHFSHDATSRHLAQMLNRTVMSRHQICSWIVCNYLCEWLYASLI